MHHVRVVRQEYGIIVIIEDNKQLDEQEKSAIQLISAFFVNSMEV